MRPSLVLCGSAVVLPLPQSAFAELKVTLSWVIKVYVFLCVCLKLKQMLNNKMRSLDKDSEHAV